MATRINRDVGQTIDLSDPHTLAEYEGFAADVPTTEGMIAAVNNPPAIPNANSVRAAHLLRPAFLFGRPVNTTVPSPDATTPTRLFARQGLHKVDLPVPSSNGGVWADVEMWSWEDPNLGGNQGWPGPMIRVRAGDLVHNDTQTRTQTHTIHHHGIEPTPMNDGVGHLTFEIAGGHYVYQWFAAEAGTYFYHCHRNTTLHFEMGMYGPLIIDPDVPGAPFTTGGPGQTYVGNTLTPYQAEALWVVDDIDTRWHGVDRDRAGNNINYGAGRPIIPTDVAAGLQAMGPGKAGDLNNAFTLISDPENPRLHDFDPNVFAVTGVPVPVNPTPRRDYPWQALIPRSLDGYRLTQMGVTVAAGAKVLVRTLNAAYNHTKWSFPAQIPGQVIASDGRTWGRAPWGERYSNPVPLADIGHTFRLSVARRWDVLLDTTGVAPGTYDVAVEVHDSLADDRVVTILLPITVQ